MHHSSLPFLYDKEPTNKINGMPGLYVTPCGLKEKRKVGGSLGCFSLVFKIFAK